MGYKLRPVIYSYLYYILFIFAGMIILTIVAPFLPSPHKTENIPPDPNSIVRVMTDYPGPVAEKLLPSVPRQSAQRHLNLFSARTVNNRTVISLPFALRENHLAASFAFFK